MALRNLALELGEVHLEAPAVLERGAMAVDVRPRGGLGMLLRHDERLLGAEDGELVASLGKLEEVGDL
eukprot:11614261-Alexandrium_andersonii.AAC.1